MDCRPLFFDGSHGPLYGVFHEAQTSARRGGVLVLPPYGQEAVRCHKMTQQLAVVLAKSGIPTLRFDFTASGNSFGPATWTVDDWRQDAIAAMSQLQQLSEQTSVSIVGIRLGASLSATLPVSVSQLVLWDPVSDGASYADCLDRMHREICVNPIYFRRPRRVERNNKSERVGHPYCQAIDSSLRQFSPLAGVEVDCQKVVWVESHENVGGAAMSDWQNTLDVPFEEQVIAMDCHWNSVSELEKVLVAPPITKSIKMALAS